MRFVSYMERSGSRVIGYMGSSDSDLSFQPEFVKLLQETDFSAQMRSTDSERLFRKLEDEN